MGDGDLRRPRERNPKGNTGRAGMRHGERRAEAPPHVPPQHINGSPRRNLKTKAHTAFYDKSHSTGRLAEKNFYSFYLLELF